MTSSRHPDAVAMATAIHDPDDPRLADYTKLKERDLSAQTDRFVAESERVVRRLIDSRLRVLSVLATPTRLASLGALVANASFPVYVAEQPVLDAIAGFHVHRGCLAIGERPQQVTLDGPSTVVVLEDLVDIDNLGATARNAAAFGADAIVLSPRCADPFYRKAIRVSVGTVFDLPILRLRRWPEDLVALQREHDLSLVGLVVDPGAHSLATVARPPRVALMLGSEGPGLSAAARAVCDRLVTIPMAAGADSLNVATAGAIALHHFQCVASRAQ